MTPPQCKNIALVIPSLAMGGMERVMSELAGFFSKETNYKISIIKLAKGTNSYLIPEKVKIYEPSFYHENYHPIIRSIKTLWFLRRTLKKVNSDIVLSFGDRYNSFVLIAALGLKMKVFVSNRMNPNASNGYFIDKLNDFFYPFATGIIAQTKRAKEVFSTKYKDNNICVIGNPFNNYKLTPSEEEKKNLILNVGRFADEKNQDLLISYFQEIEAEGWKLWFLGEGHKLKKVKEEYLSYEKKKDISFLGNKKNIESYYQQAKIFAFTSTTEGFPNALGEAMAAGCACISFDCETGPSDLIDDGINGFLIKNMDHETYKRKLLILMENEELREEFGKNAQNKLKQFSMDKIGRRYLEFILN